MATERGQEFEIKIAKAKDLPLSWFDLVLRPEKFKQHLKTLEKNPNVEPTGLQLVATFLEKGGVLEGQSPLPTAEANNNSGSGAAAPAPAAVVEERRKRLVSCALFIASFLQWDLALFEKSLPPAVAYSLLAQLTKSHPLKTTRTSSDQTPSHPLSEEHPSTLTAHVLYCHWVVRYLNLCNLPADARRATNSWDVTCANSEQIKSILEPQLPQCVDFLEEACRHANSFCLPSVAVSLPVLGRQEGEFVELILPSAGREVPASEIHCQLHYSLGCHYFWQDDYTKARSAFNQSQQLLSSLPSCPAAVDAAQMAGFAMACQVIGQKVKAEQEDAEEEGEEEGGRIEEKSLVERLERCRVSDPEQIVDLLTEDLAGQTLPLPTCTALERELTHLAEDTSQQPPAKRPKMDSSSLSSLPLHQRVCVCNTTRAVVQGLPIQPHFWQIFSTDCDSRLYQFLFHVCYEALHHHNMEEREHKHTRTIRLQTFVRSVCSLSPNPQKVWDILFQSRARDLAMEGDQQVIQRLFTLAPPPPKSSSSPSSSSSSSPHCPEKQILYASSCQELLSSVDQCFKSLPPSEYKAFAQKWVGSGNGFATFDVIADPVLLTKYNAMVHKAHQLRKAQCYTESVRFLRAALGLLPKPSGSQASPDQALLDQVLWVELKGAGLEIRRLSPRELTKRFAGLIEKAKSYCKRSYSLYPEPSDPMTLCLTAAFLLNTQSYQHLAAVEHPFTPGKVAPRLAIAAMNIRDDRDARKSIRDLFGAVLSVFSTPVTGGSETRSEVDQKQLQLRAQLDVLVENLELDPFLLAPPLAKLLKDPASLTLLLLALARIWVILKKPEEELLLHSEHSMYWPTVIGSPGSVNADHVFRALSSSLSHALSVHPQTVSWVLLQGEIHYATGQEGAALVCYLKAGAMTSQYFETEIPPDVWSTQVYRKIISCCSRLGYYTHVVLFCQLLEPVDYDLAFSVLNTHSSLMAESLFTYFWDMAIIEYLIYINAKKGEKYKQAVAVQIAGQPELNCNNSEEVLSRAVEVRRRKFLRAFFEQSLSKP